MDHHALLFIGTYEDALVYVPEVYRNSDIDTHHVRQPRFSIDAARTLREEASKKPLQKEKRSFIIETEDIPTEAQNALLRLLEDPPCTAQFLIILPHERNIIPTLRSRLHLISSPKTQVHTDVFSAFKDASYEERLTDISEKVRAKDTAWIQALLAGVEQYVSAHPRDMAAVGKDIVMIQSYSATKGASHKMLLEHIALTLPR